MRRKHSPQHDFWHRRVEGQIRHTIGCHPEWFTVMSHKRREAMINSLAKRIVGEIIVGVRIMPAMPGTDVVTCASQAESGDGASVSPHAQGVPVECALGDTFATLLNGGQRRALGYF